MSRKRTARRQREHRPHVLGPRIFTRGRWLAADLRPWGGKRTTLRDPSHPQWPRRGERTEEPEVARRWAWAYVDLLRGAIRRTQLKLPNDSKRLDVAVAEYLAHRANTVEPFTLRNDHSALTVHLLECDGTVGDITTEQLQHLFNTLAPKYRPSTLATYRTVMLAFFNWCGRKSDHNPASAVVVRAGHASDVAGWSDDELRELRKVAKRLDRQRVRDRKWPDSFLRCLEVGVATGGRFRELCALEWSRFRADNTVRFNVQVDERGSGTKGLKGKRNRTALVLPSLYRHLPKFPTTGHVLTPSPLRGFVYGYAEKWMEWLYEKAELRGRRTRWHALRHTYGRVFLEMGGSLEQLQMSMGHASIRTTEITYKHFTHDSAAALARARIYGADHAAFRARSGRISGTGKG